MRVARLKHVPTWVVHGSADDSVPSGYAEQMVAAMQAAGETVKLTLIKDGAPNLPADFDQRYSCVEFSFKAGCPSDLDCCAPLVCPPPKRTEPEINYLAKDYESFRQLILDRLAVIMPDWRERHVPDIGIALVEVLAYVGDYLSYYQDAVATEAYLDTARRRISVRRHARLVDYRMHDGCNARAWVCLWTSSDLPLRKRKVMLSRTPFPTRWRKSEKSLASP